MTWQLGQKGVRKLIDHWPCLHQKGFESQFGLLVILFYSVLYSFASPRLMFFPIVPIISQNMKTWCRRKLIGHSVEMIGGAAGAVIWLCTVWCLYAIYVILICTGFLILVLLSYIFSGVIWLCRKAAFSFCNVWMVSEWSLKKSVINLLNPKGKNVEIMCMYDSTHNAWD